jgi:ribulose-bisphosphate carboxylase small chain
MTVQDYRSSLSDPESRKYGTFSYLPAMSDARLKELIGYLVKQGWTPAIEHVEPDRAGDDYWYMWKLPLFGETDTAVVLGEVNGCREAYPGHLIRVIGYDPKKQTQGTCVVLR